MEPDFGFLVGCSPQCQFYSPRSYYQNLWFTTGGWPSTFVDGTFTLFVGSPLVYTEVLVLRPNFYEWNSNFYSLDYIVEQVYYFVPSGSPSPAGVGVAYYPDQDVPASGILFDFIATGTPWTKYNLPAAPPEYWRPEPFAP